MTVSGRVVKADGKPLAGVVVLPALDDHPSTRTSDDGEFMLAVNLMPDMSSFSLRFKSPGYFEKFTTINIQQASGSGSAVVDVLMNPSGSWASVAGMVQKDSG
jgi:hypothetical protein